jgi:uncharacterized membrane protein YgaE (UPF0421/DUF939 family)
MQRWIRSGWWRSGYLRLAVLTTAAATAAYAVGVALPYIDPVPAAITAVISTRPTFHHAAKEALFQVTGVVTGALVAFAAIVTIGFGPLTIALLVLTSFAIVRVIRVADPASAPHAAMAVAVTTILVIGAQLSPEGAFERFMGVVVGGGFALLASYFTTRGEPVGRISVELTAVQGLLADLLGQIAEGVQQPLTKEHTKQWFRRATALRDETAKHALAVQDVREHRRWSPAIHEAELRALERQLGVTQVMATRVLSIASDLNQLTKKSPKQLPAEQLSPLAKVFASAAATMVNPDLSATGSNTGVQTAIRSADDTEALMMLGGLAGQAQQLSRLRREAQSEDTGAQEPAD